MTGRREPVRRMRALATRYQLQAADMQRLRDLIAASPVKPGPGVTVQDMLDALPATRRAEAVQLGTRLRRTALQLGLTDGGGIIP